MITTINITKMESRKYVKDNPAGTLQINHSMTLKTPKILERNTILGNQSVLSIEFQMFISYLHPSIGEIMFEGNVDYFNFVEKPSDKIIEAWDAMDNDDVNKIKTEVANKIMGNIIPFASIIAQKIDLPSVFPIPRLLFGKPPQAQQVKKEETQSYIG